MSLRHPTDLVLEQHLQVPSLEVAQHLRDCAGCQARLREADAQEAEFRARVFPRTVDAVAAGRAKPWVPFPRLWPLGLAGAAAAAVVVVAVLLRGPPAPAPDYLGIKGAFSLTVYRAGPSPVAVTDGAAVPADAVLAFHVRSSAPCSLTLLSLDPASSVLLPAAGRPPPRIEGEVRLETGAQLDGRAGPERLVALCARSAADLPAAVEQVRKSLGGGFFPRAERVPGLPPGVEQASLRVEKTP